MRRLIESLFVAPILATSVVAAEPPKPHNVLLFVADGLRPGMINEQTTPTMAALLKRGVTFSNTHAVFPTLTTTNAASIATGHMPGDTGDFGNTIYTAFPGAGGSPTPFLESDTVLGEIDAHFGGNYLNECSDLPSRCRRRPLHRRDRQARSQPDPGPHRPRRAANSNRRRPDRRARRPPPNARNADLLAGVWPGQCSTVSRRQRPVRRFDPSGTHVANIEQQKWFADVAALATLPTFKDRRKPFVMVFWSRDPDGTQHNQGDLLMRLIPESMEPPPWRQSATPMPTSQRCSRR